MLTAGLMVGSKSILRRGGHAADAAVESSSGDEGEFDPRSQPYKSAWMETSAWPDPAAAPPLMLSSDSKERNGSLTGRTSIGRLAQPLLGLQGEARSSSRTEASQVGGWVSG